MESLGGGNFALDGRTIRFSRGLDAETERFEAELLERPSLDLLTGEAAPIELALEQQHVYLRETPREFHLFQLRDLEGKAAMQAAVYVSRSRLSRDFGHAIVLRLGQATTGVEEQFGLRVLRGLCAGIPGVMTLRLQAMRLEPRRLFDFEARARRAGYQLVDPVGTTRTLIYDLRPELDTLLTEMKRKTRGRIKHRSRDLVTISALEDPSFIARCREAESAARTRTTGARSEFDFETLFRLAKAHPDRVFIAGLFLLSRPTELMAFVTGLRHGKVAEYTAAGSFRDQELRSIPFNTFLIWEMVRWARASGAEQLDFGGVTESGPEDPLAGISEFKRQFCEREAEVGREMLTVLRPHRLDVFRGIQAVKGLVNRVSRR